MGDLADLRGFSNWADGLGARFMLINPLFASTPAPDPEASPYSPATRRFRSPLYLRIEEVPGADRLGPLLADLAAAGRALNAAPTIERGRVQALKQRALEAIWASGTATAGEEPRMSTYRSAVGEGLREWAVYRSLAERHGNDWHDWPAPLRTLSLAAVAAAARDMEPRIAFHEWVQWLVDEQMARAGGPLRLVADLPVGFDANGFDAWAWQPLLADGVVLGAPPDSFNPDGQDWGLPPFAPDPLRTAGYAPFIDTLRASLRHAGGLRIDHALGLFRQWWIPAGRLPTEGAYVGFPADELLAVLKLESVRAGVPVIGEDLGVPEPGSRRALARAGVLSIRLGYFEGRLAALPELAMAAITTHDLPTIAGAWTGSDGEELREMGLDGASRAAGSFHRRVARLTGLTPGRSARDAVLAAYRSLSTSPARLAVVSLEDALVMRERPNVPGTTTAQRANWSRGLRLTLEQVRTDAFARRLARTMTAARPRGPVNRD